MNTWQTCPKCNGQGTLLTPPYIAGDQLTFISGTFELFACNVCNGKMIISRETGLPPVDILPQPQDNHSN